MANVPTNALGFIIVLGFLIFAHEAGHFFTAKMFGVRVLVFSFGFGKRLFGFRRGDTDYRVSLVPLGGYVRMAGDMPEENQAGSPDEFLSKPKWQRFLILFAGPFMNIVIAIAFLAIINMVGTEQAIIPPVVGEIQPNMPAARAGLLPGDRIVQVKDEKIERFEDLMFVITLNAGTPLRVEYIRNGERRVTTLTPQRVEERYGPVGRAGIVPFYEPLVGRVVPGTPAEKAGIRSGDRIVAVNGKPIKQLTEFYEVYVASKGGPIRLDLQRSGQRIATVLPAGKDDEQQGYRGFLPPTRIQKLTLGPAIEESMRENWRLLRFAFTALGRLFRTEGSMKELSGPLRIASISGEMLRRGWMNVIALMAMISLQLGVLNLLPVPMLDGGHIMILLIEGAARRDLSLAVKERIQQVGFALIAALMLVVLYYDVVAHVLPKG